MLAAGALDGSVALLDSPFPTPEYQQSPVVDGDALESESAIGLENLSRFQGPHESNDVT